MATKRPHKRTTGPETAPAGRHAGAPVRTPSSSSRPVGPRSPSGPRAARKLEVPVPQERTPQAPLAERLHLKALGVVLAALAALSLVGAMTLVILSNTSAFSITGIEAQATEHVSSEDIAALAGVPEGTTLLNYDEDLIASNLRRNPWVEGVTLSRQFPDTLRITVIERKVKALVMMDSGRVIWCLGEDDVWIEPVKVTAAEGQSITEAVLAMAKELDALVITDVPQTVNPVAGSLAEGGVFEAIATFRAQLSFGLWDQVVSIDAPSVEAISCILDSGVEVSLGSPTSIETKEAVLMQLLEKYPNRLTYINVRVPSNPSYRMIDSEAVEGGTGALGDISS